jgi:hypothetical protein
MGRPPLALPQKCKPLGCLEQCRLVIDNAPDLPVTFPAEAVLVQIFESNAVVRGRLWVELPRDMDRAVAGITSAHRALDLFRARLQPSLQTATLELFFHSAIHALVCSVHHHVSGYPIAAGNMMRHQTESVDMVNRETSLMLLVAIAVGWIPFFRY